MRNPSVFYFNPTCELAVANGSFSYNPPRLLQKFEDDCSIIPFVFGASGDYVLTKNSPSTDFILKMTDLGFELPQFCTLHELIEKQTEAFESLCPWGWSPAAHFYLKDLKPRCIPEFQESPVYQWTNDHLLLYERITSLNFLKDFLDKNNSPDFLIEPENIGQKVSCISEIEALLSTKHQLVLKAPLSSSGRGIQIIWKSKLNESNKQWISGVLNQQNYLIAEPFLEKVTDFSFQFRIDNEKIEYLGHTVFETNSNGQYKCTLVHPELKSLFCPKTEELINISASLIGQSLKDSGYARFHRGFLGIDAMIFQEDGKQKIQPCIEINSRMNMGILTKQLERFVHKHSSGKFELFYGQAGDYKKFVKEKSTNHHLKTENGKLSAGFLSLTEPTEKTQFGAYLEIGTDK
jgi:hypothetical protein